jgi:hypothetical protein
MEICYLSWNMPEHLLRLGIFLSREEVAIEIRSHELKPRLISTEGSILPSESSNFICSRSLTGLGVAVF